MRPVALRFCMLVAAMIVPAIAAAQTAQIVGPQQSPPEVRAHILERMNACTQAGGQSSVAPQRQTPLVTAFDWDGDGRPDFLVDSQAIRCTTNPPPHCVGGCDYSLFVARGAQHVNVGSVRGRGQSLVQGGRPMLRITEGPEPGMYGWTGSAFASLSPPARPAQPSISTAATPPTPAPAQGALSAAVTDALPMADLILAMAPTPGARHFPATELTRRTGPIRQTLPYDAYPYSVGRAWMMAPYGPVESLDFTNPHLAGTTAQGGARMDPRSFDLPRALENRGAILQPIVCIGNNGSGEARAYAVRLSGKAPFWINIVDWHPRSAAENYVFSAAVSYSRPPTAQALLDGGESEETPTRC